MADEIPLHERRVVYTLPGMDAVEVRRDLVYRSADCQKLLMDVYLPPASQRTEPLPGVVFIHGGPIPEGWGMKGTGQYLSWGELTAASGFVSFTFNHRYYAGELLKQSAEDVEAAVAYVHDHADDFGLDANRLCLWVCSGGGPHICFSLQSQPTYIRTLVIYYAILDIREVDYLTSALDEETIQRFSAVRYIEDQPVRFPIFVARAGQDHLGLNETIDNFVMRALRGNATIEVMNHPLGQHAFDIRDDDDRSRQIIGRTLAFMQENT